MTKDELILEIQNAFKDIKLEDGIGMYESNCIDDYDLPDSPKYILEKKKDERENWEKLLPFFLSPEIPVGFLLVGRWGYMDAKGKRFVLPALLIQELEVNRLNNPFYDDLVMWYSTAEWMTILSETQVSVIIKFFEFQLEKFIQNDDVIYFDLYFYYLEAFKQNF